MLAEDVTSDIDSPPHDKAMVDGYAVIASDSGPRTVIEEVTAGRIPQRTVTPGTATRIMTGAPVPEGADAVVMVERTETLADGKVRLLNPPATPAQHIMRKATAMRRGDVVLRRGAEVRPLETGLLAEVGCTRPLVVPRPTASVLATGDELVPPDEVPAAGQLRNSNSPMLVAAARRAGAVPIDLGIAADDPEQLKAQREHASDQSCRPVHTPCSFEGPAKARDQIPLRGRDLVCLVACALFADNAQQFGNSERPGFHDCSPRKGCLSPFPPQTQC